LKHHSFNLQLHLLLSQCLPHPPARPLPPLTSPVPTTVHLIRHAQGFHNLTPLNHSMPDPTLTPLGEMQCASLSSAFPYTPLVTHLVSSPLRRTLYTTLLSFEDLVLPAGAAPGKGLRVIALPEIQETSDLPCDTGSAAQLLADEFAAGRWAGTVDLGLVQEGWNDKGISTRWAPTPRNLERRSREARVWLRALARGWEEGRRAVGGEEEAHIVVVTHGGLLHFLTEDWSGYEKRLGELSCYPLAPSGTITGRDGLGLRVGSCMGRQRHRLLTIW